MGFSSLFLVTKLSAQISDILIRMQGKSFEFLDCQLKDFGPLI